MESKIKVLAYIDWYLPGYMAGGPIRSLANLVHHLRESHEFYIITRNTDYQSEQPYPGIIPNTWQLGPVGEHVLYLDRGHLGLGFLRKVISDLEYDMVYVNGLFSWHFSIKPLRLHRKAPVDILLAPRGMLRGSAMAIKGTKKRLFLNLARRANLFKQIRFQATDQQEFEDITRLIGADASVEIVPNLPRPLPAFRSADKASGQLELVFVGRVAPEKNLAFALDCLREISGVTVRLTIYGAIYNKEYWAECQAHIEQMPSNIEVHYQGHLPSEDVMDRISKADALFLPSRGENFGHVILESWMASRPVLISDQTPWKDLREGEGAILALDDMEGFRAQICSWAAADSDLWNSYAEAAFAKAERYCGNESVKAAAKALFSPR